MEVTRFDRHWRDLSGGRMIGSPPYAVALGRKTSMPTVRPKAIVFDTFGTVVDWRSSLITDLSEYGARKGVQADWAGLVDAWRAAYHPSMDRVRRGEQPWTKLDDLHRASLDHLVKEFRIQGLEEADLDHINRGWHRLHAWPDSIPGLLRLKSRFI